MFKNYFKITIRTLLKNKFFSLLNILGLATGISACLFITQYVFFESGFDTFHEDANQIYRISHTSHQGNIVAERSATTYAGLSEVIGKDLPQIKKVTSFYPYDCILLSKNETDIISHKEENVLRVDEFFLDIFSFPLIKGSKASLKEVNTVFLTESTAEKFFPDTDPIGKAMRIMNYNQGLDMEAIVRGVLKDLPANSHIQFSCLFTTQQRYNQWNYAENYTYVKLVEGADPQVLESQLPALLKKYKGDLTSQNKVTLGLQPLSTIHLYSDLVNELTVNGNGKLVWFMSLIAILILLIAFINYINLSSIKAIDRAKEVGLRKTFGVRSKNPHDSVYF